MKTCTHCLTEKVDEEFSFKNKEQNKRRSTCRPCYSDLQKNRYQRSESGKTKRRLSNQRGQVARRQRNREFVWSYLSEHPCRECGLADPIVLEFDHRDASCKTTEVSLMVAGCWSIERIEEEIAKCDVLCANCHRRKTAKQLGWWAGQ